MVATQSVSTPESAVPAPGAAARDVDPKLYRTVMGRFATGITVVTTRTGGQTHGMTANAFMAGSLEPPLCLISVRKEARLHEHLLACGRYGVSFLSEEQQHLSNHFAGRRLPGVAPEFVELDGVPVLSRALAVIVADVVDTAGCGDHTLFIGRILRMQATSGPPLLFYSGRYARLDSRDPIEQISPPTFW